MSLSDAPEVAPARGLEVPFDGVELDRDVPYHLPDSRSIVEKEARPPVQFVITVPRYTRSRWLLLGFLAVLVIIAVIVGAVEGMRHQRIGPSHAPPSSPPGLPTSNSTVNLSQRILLNTSVASAICPTGNRWIFFQDQRNDVRAAIQTPGSTWTFLNMTIPSIARPGSPLSASCVTLSSSMIYSDARLAVLTAGVLISIIYLDEFEFLGQSFFNAGSWSSVDTTCAGQKIIPRIPGRDGPPAIPASAKSRLSISTNILPASTSASYSRTHPTMNNSFVAPSELLSSVAVYQANGTAIMVDLIGTTERYDSLDDSKYSIDNLFTQFQFYDQDGLISVNGVFSSLKTLSSPGFTCSYNSIGNYLHPIEVLIITSSGSRTLICVGLNEFALAFYEPYMLGYNNSQVTGFYDIKNVFNNLSSTYNGVDSATPEPASNNTDLNIVPLPGPAYAVTFLSDAGNIKLVSLSSLLAASWTEPIPYGHISSSTGNNSNIVYTYYQVNETTMAEVTYDPETGSWSPTQFSIDAIGL